MKGSRHQSRCADEREFTRVRGTVPSGKLILIVFAVALVFAVGCKRRAASSAALFPSSGEVAGWAKTGETRTFEAADLWRYIDGDAERYLKAGVQRVSTADYKFQDRVEATADIYTMGDAQGAAKILDSEPAGDAKSVQLGDGARSYGQSLVFRKGPALVRIVAYQDSGETPQAILQLARSIEGRLGR